MNCERCYTGQRKRIQVPLGKFFNLNLTQTEMPHVGSLLGEEGNSIALINKVVRAFWAGTNLPHFTTCVQAVPMSRCSESTGKLAKMQIPWP